MNQLLPLGKTQFPLCGINDLNRRAFAAELWRFWVLKAKSKEKSEKIIPKRNLPNQFLFVFPSSDWIKPDFLSLREMLWIKCKRIGNSMNDLTCGSLLPPIVSEEYMRKTALGVVVIRHSSSIDVTCALPQTFAGTNKMKSSYAIELS